MSNQHEAEFVNGIFCIQSFWGGHGKISPKNKFMPKGAICLELPIQPTGRVFHSRNSQIANQLEPFNGPSEI
jgi:hypothetical protein